MPATVQTAHSAPLRARGTADVSSGNWLAKAVARVLDLPRPGEGVTVTIDVETKGGVIICRRTFSGRTFSSVQWREGEKLVEKFGPVLMFFTVVVTGRCVEYSTDRVTLFKLRLPRLIAAKTDAVVCEDGDGWIVAVNVRSPLLGVLCRYKARLEAA